jgi:hypothetical protein
MDRVCTLAVFFCLAVQVHSEPQILGARSAGDSGIDITYTSAATNYYILLRGDAVTNIDTPAALRVPSGSPDVFTDDLQAPLSFFAVAQQDRSAPGDIDGDGMDDVYEFLHGLDAFDPTDASELDPGGSGLTNYQVYRILMGYDLIPGIVVSREVSTVNLGGTGASYEAVSREVSVVNEGGAGAAYEAISREVSVFDEGGAGAVYEAVSREVSVFNDGGAAEAIEAISREVSVWNFQ